MPPTLFYEIVITDADGKVKKNPNPNPNIQSDPSVTALNISLLLGDFRYYHVGAHLIQSTRRLEIA